MSYKYYKGEVEGMPQAKWTGDIYAEAAERLLCPTPSVKVPGFDFFNRITGGFRPREFSILCGSTGSGKTQLLAAWSAAMVKQRIKHFVASVETGPHDFVMRMMSSLVGKDFNSGDGIPLADFERFEREYGELIREHVCRLALHENRIKVEHLLAEIEREVVDNGVQVVFLDNMNFFMEVTRSSDSLIEMDRVIHEFIIFCKQVDVHVVMVMHPKKTVDSRIESEFDIKGSSTAVQEAHNVFLWNRPNKKDLETNFRHPSDRELKIAKMRRRGKYVGKTILMTSPNFGASLIEKEAF